MTAPCRRVVTFAGSSVAVEHDGARAGAIVDFLYRHAPGDQEAPPGTTYRLEPDTRTGHLALYRDDALIYRGTSDGAVAEFLMGDSCHYLARAIRGGLLFHAAGLAHHGKGLLMPGTMGAGKTTLAAWLTLKGLDHLTDEMAFVPHGARCVQALTRPLNLKGPARTALQDDLDFEARAKWMMQSSRGYLIPPELLNAANRLCEPPLHLIVFPHYAPASDLELRRLTRAQAGLALMQCLVNARSLPGHGFGEIARLARMAPAYRLRYSTFGQIDGRIEALLDKELAPPDLA